MDQKDLQSSDDDWKVVAFDGIDDLAYLDPYDAGTDTSVPQLPMEIIRTSPPMGSFGRKRKADPSATRATLSEGPKIQKILTGQPQSSSTIGQQMIQQLDQFKVAIDEMIKKSSYYSSDVKKRLKQCVSDYINSEKTTISDHTHLSSSEQNALTNFIQSILATKFDSIHDFKRTKGMRGNKYHFITCLNKIMSGIKCPFQQHTAQDIRLQILGRIKRLTPEKLRRRPQEQEKLLQRRRRRERKINREQGSNIDTSFSERITEDVMNAVEDDDRVIASGSLVDINKTIWKPLLKKLAIKNLANLLKQFVIEFGKDIMTSVETQYTGDEYTKFKNDFRECVNYYITKINSTDHMMHSIKRVNKFRKELLLRLIDPESYIYEIASSEDISQLRNTVYSTTSYESQFLECIIKAYIQKPYEVLVQLNISSFQNRYDIKQLEEYINMNEELRRFFNGGKMTYEEAGVYLERLRSSPGDIAIYYPLIYAFYESQYKKTPLLNPLTLTRTVNDLRDAIMQRQQQSLLKTSAQLTMPSSTMMMRTDQHQPTQQRRLSQQWMMSQQQDDI